MNNYDVLDNSKLIDDSDIDHIKTAISIMGDIYSKAYNQMLENEEEKKQLQTDFECPHCSDFVFISDLIDYAYVCLDCDENMYLGEGDLNREWYYSDKEDLKLTESFVIQLEFDQSQQDVYISFDDGSYVKYDCERVSDIKNAVGNSISDYLSYINMKNEKNEMNYK